MTLASGLPESLVEWLERRTWHHTVFDADDLAARKTRAGHTVSVVVPALDEEATVAGVVGSVRGPLVDEIIVVDGGSTDATADRAAAAGARVVDQHATLVEAGPGRGKGDALWKGLASTSGDLVVFLDADVADPSPHFVVGLLGPLLTEPSVACVKGFYDRPLRTERGLRPAGGGRVTELTARPLIASFWPELSGIAQPLAGEYAARRSVLEQVPFVQGYGVEFALLTDLAGRLGIEAIGQVDLGRRLHDHQPLDALARMSAEIFHVALTRLAVQGWLVFARSPATTLPQPVRDASGAMRLRMASIGVSERPPLGAQRSSPVHPPPREDRDGGGRDLC